MSNFRLFCMAASSFNLLVGVMSMADISAPAPEALVAINLVWGAAIVALFGDRPARKIVEGR